MKYAQSLDRCGFGCDWGSAEEGARWVRRKNSPFSSQCGSWTKAGFRRTDQAALMAMPSANRKKSAMNLLKLSLATLLIFQANIPVFAGQACANKPLTRLPSPNGSRDAVFFIWHCEGSADYISKVAIVPKGQPIPDKPDRIFTFGHRVQFTAVWSSEDELIVASPSASPTPQEAQVGGVTIMYKYEKRP